MTRTSHLASFTLLAASLMLTACQSTQRGDGGKTITITHGPMLGHVTHDSVRIWARTSRPGKVYVVYYEFPQSGEYMHDEVSFDTSIGHDNTGHIELTRLKPGVQYHYALDTRAPVSGTLSCGAPSGTFRTLPDPAALKDPQHNPRGLFNFSFEFACGNNQAPEHGVGPTLPVYDTLNAQVRDKVHFAILNGDWLYEEDRDYPPTAWRDQVGVAEVSMPDIVKTAPTITGVWENYKKYMSRGKNLAEWHRHVPTYYTFDDHELLNDVFACGETGYRNRRAVFRDIGVRGWYDYLGWANPVAHDQPVHFGRAKLTAGSDVLTDTSADFTKLDMQQAANLHVHWGTANAGVKDIPEGDEEGGDPNARVYEIVEVLDAHRVRIRPAAVDTRESSYSIGRRSYGAFRVGNCAFYLVDTRTHRTMHDTKNPAKPTASMLGKQQEQWLLAEMKRNNDADFHFVVSSVNFMIPHVGGGGAAFDAATKDDAWTVFLDQRERLINHWDALDAPVFVLTGDLHNSFAIKITDNVWEFASGPHNSVNHRAVDEGNRPVNGAFKYGPRPCEIRWSTTAMADIPRDNRLFPHYCVVQVNNVFNNPVERDGTRLIAYPRPHVIFKYYDAFTGELKYAEPIHAAEK